MLKFNRPVIALVGCGGTGSYMIDHLGRLLGYYGELKRLQSSLVVLIDADTVSQSNTVRQNFGYRDLNEQKGAMLQRKLQQHYTVSSVDFWASYTNKRLLEKLMKKVGTQNLIAISCVDNHRTRNRIMSFLKPDPDSFTDAKPSNWLYLDAGNDTTSGWSSAMGMYNGSGFGCDMRQHDINMRNDDVDVAPELGGNTQGCGAATSSPETYICNQMNSYLLASQLRSICLKGKGYGVLAYKRSDLDSEDWMTQSYENHYLAPFELP
jgi:hypothetical protein